MTQVGQTVSGAQFNKMYPVGTTVSGKDFAAKYGQTSQTPQTPMQGAQYLANTRGTQRDPAMEKAAIAPFVNSGAGAVGGINVTKGLTAAGGKIIPLLKGVVQGAEKTVYPKLEEATANAGRSTWDLINKHLNSDTVKDIGTASQKTQVGQILKKEVSGLASNYGNVSANKGPLFNDILKLRSAAGNAANYAKGSAPTIENQVNRAFQSAYSQMLKEGAGTANLDKLYSLLKKVDSIKGMLKKGVMYGSVGAAGYKVGNSLLKKIGL